MVQIAQLKSRLSEHLRAVQAGSRVTVLDRQTPIAMIVPHEPAPSVRVRRPLASAPGLRDVPLPPPLRPRIDAVRALLEERQGDR
jgi:antitoxin (DNA-binding transcriptional repressor) of toxin-antitoxin stability system